MGITKPNNPPLRQQLLAALPTLEGNARYLVAYSGGLDSTVLLHAMRGSSPLRAVHVNHGMQASAPAWQAHCEAQCATWRVTLDILRVSVDSARGGPEAAARAARYAALAGCMQPDDVLLTAQHADDQAETFLLQALRGAGVHGLAAMPAGVGFGPGKIARPLLQYTRTQLREYAQTHDLEWVDDPSNSDSRLGRAYLRQRVAPPLREHWPQFAQCLTRAAAWSAQAAELNDELAALDLQNCGGPVPQCLSAAALQDMSPARQTNLLRYWLRSLALAPPDHRHLQQVHTLLRGQRPDAQPLVAWADTELRRFRDWIFAMRRLVPVSEHRDIAWDMRQSLELPDGCGRLEPGRRASSVIVRFRRGGERLQLNGRNHHSHLKQVLQAACVPPWVRARLPLLCRGEEIVAVADYWRRDGALELRWTQAPPGADLARVVGAEAFR